MSEGGKSAAQRKRLVLVPAPLDHGCLAKGEVPPPITDTLPLATLQQAAGITHWIAENARSARALLGRIAQVVPLAVPMQQQSIVELPRAVHKKGDHNAATGFDARPLLAPALAGHDVGLCSEAGLPAVADPGSAVVRAAHALHLEVLPLTGPSSLLLALAASGLNGQSFAFVGYLPQKAGERTQRIRELQTLARRSGQAQLFIEAPYRNAALLRALLETLDGSTRLAVSAGLTLAGSITRSARVDAWRTLPPLPDAALALPMVFAIGV